MNTLFDLDFSDSSSEGSDSGPTPGPPAGPPRTLRRLTLTAPTWEDITRWSRSQNSRTAYRHVVGQTGFTGTWRVALVVVAGNVAGGVVVRRWGRPGRGQDGLEIATAEPIRDGISWDRLAHELPEARKGSLDRDDGDAMPPVTSAALEAALERLAPGSIASLNRLFAAVKPVDRGTGVEALIREQRDAVALALEVGGFDSRDLLAEGPSEEGSVPFLTGLVRGRTTEASVLRHEASVLDGWLSKESSQFDVTTFQDPTNSARRMSIFYADKEQLERQTGTDLIYYRHHRAGFILVQYKRMRKAAGSREATYYPDDQLRRELARARALPTAATPRHPNEWRLTEDSFYVKLVADDLARPTANKLVRGMYLPGSLVDLLLASGDRDEVPRGWSAKNLTTYLSNEEFLQLAKQGYVGTRGATTAEIIRLITGAFTENKGVIVAVDETDPMEVERPRHG